MKDLEDIWHPLPRGELGGAHPAVRNEGKNKFLSHAERNAFLMDVVFKYNRTRLRCLDYHAPAELLANHPGDNASDKVSQWSGCTI